MELIEAVCDADTASDAGLTSTLHMALSLHSSIGAKDSSGSTALHKAVASCEVLFWAAQMQRTSKLPGFVWSYCWHTLHMSNAVDDRDRNPIQLAKCVGKYCWTPELMLKRYNLTSRSCLNLIFFPPVL
eukprot:GILI01060099.1.p1 GENE.GILI01060099.1~~GILI01060099.1.p1  ORF type:complete len:129 (-),score=1.26 GILI01060099.1:63-449(-)